MIKAIIADVDGVMVGKLEGFNFPLPHDDVINSLKKLNAKGVPIILCSAKFRVAIDGIIQQAQLKNPHISDNGALIIDPLGHREIIEQNLIDKTVVEEYLSENESYTELYSPKAYFVIKDADPKFMDKRAQLLQMEPILVDSLKETSAKEAVIKIISFSEDESDMPIIEEQVKRLGNRINYIWSHHPFIMPRRPCVMTAPGVSKERALKLVASYLNINLGEILGIGDLPADWSFMQLCGYVGMVGDNTELRDLVLTKGKRSYIGKSVDKHGLIDIFEHFKL